MSFFQKTIFTGLAPNLNKRNVLAALGWLCLPWRWFRWHDGQGRDQVERWLKDYHQAQFACTLDSGRSGLFIALQALGIQPGDEVLVQGYTCAVVINAILWAKATPRYVDVREDGNMDPEALSVAISPKTKVLIIQHTFGLPADLTRLLDIAHGHNIQVIEDCAHALGATHQGKPVGSFGTIGMYSFGRDKVVSCVRGGALITSDPALAKRIRLFTNKLPRQSTRRVLQHLLFYPIFALGKPWYQSGIGKAFFWLTRRLRLFSLVIEPAEKRAEMVPGYPAQLPNVLACLLFDELTRLEKKNQHRRVIAALYDKKLSPEASLSLPPTPVTTPGHIYLRYTIHVSRAGELRTASQKNNIHLGDWYDTVIAPRDILLERLQYKTGECPVAEGLSQTAVNLPTQEEVNEQAAERIAAFILQYQTTHRHQ